LVDKANREIRVGKDFRVGKVLTGHKDFRVSKVKGLKVNKVLLVDKVDKDLMESKDRRVSLDRKVHKVLTELRGIPV
jgi:hypothetical protein